MTYTFSATLWQAENMAPWVFLSLPQDVSDAIRHVPRPPKPGFGSIRVNVTIGSTTWQTSIFPEKNEGPYVLPVKKAVRVAANAEIGDALDVTIKTIE